MTKLAMDRSTSVQKLKDADCPPLLAEAIVDVVSISQAEVVTKSDFESMKKDFIRLEDGIKQQQEEIIDLGVKVNDLNHEFQGLRKDFLSFDEKAELRWKAQQAESQVLVAKIEAIDTKLETKLEAFESKLETDDSNLDTKLAAFDSKLDSIEVNVDTKLDAFNTKLDFIETNVNTKLAAFDTKLDSIETNVNTKLDAFDSKLDTKLEAFESKLEAAGTNADTKFEAFESKNKKYFEAFEAKFSAFQNRVLLAVAGGVLLAVGIVEGIEFLKNL